MSAQVGIGIRRAMRLDRLGNTPEAIAERIRCRGIREQVDRERESRFPVLTSENAKEAIAWQESRIKELTEARS